MRIPFHILSFLLAVGVAFGCGARHKGTDPVELAPEACCTVADQELQHFAGCRVGGRCRSAEIFWMRGAVTCGPVDEADCAGGRCCHYRPRYGPGRDGPASDVAEASVPEQPGSEPGDASVEEVDPAGTPSVEEPDEGMDEEPSPEDG